MKNFKTHVLSFGLGVFALAFAGCSNEKSSSQQPVTPPVTPSAAAPAATPAAPTTVPETFKAKFVTTKGDFTVEVTRSLAPNGADRFYQLVNTGFFSDIAFFRVVPGFMVQFGIHGDPAVSAKWRDANITDDAVKTSNERGTITFATAGPNTRTSQLFINYGNNSFLDGQGFSPFGKVVEGMDVVDKINSQYGETPNQGAIQQVGNEYLKKEFPNLDYIKSASIVTDAAK
jgi:peptidyl-prolyl cis-trans isomerase A (cyclophilin A)